MIPLHGGRFPHASHGSHPFRLVLVCNVSVLEVADLLRTCPPFQRQHREVVQMLTVADYGRCYRGFGGIVRVTNSLRSTQMFIIKGTGQPKIRHAYFSLSPVVLFETSRLFSCELPILEDISHRDVWLLSYIMELDGTRLGVFSAEKMHLNLNSGAMSLSEIMTRLLKITHRYCCERFHIETFFFWEACSYSWMRAQPRRRTPIMFTSCTVTTSSRWSMIRCKRGATVCGYNLVERK